jgi:sulfite exporter TauE/SafE
VDGSWLVGHLPVAGVGAAAALTTGLVGSGHCALMCGPLACAGETGDPGARRRSALAWQAGRLGAYAGTGALLGTFGHAVLAALSGRTMRALPLVMAAGLVFWALELGKSFPALPGIARIPRALMRTGAKFSPAVRALLRGAATPFLPCGLLYGAFVMAAAAGSLLGGATIMTAFALGALPALAAVQALVPGSLGRVTRSPRVVAVSRRAIPLLAAAVIVWRALAAGAATAAPHCH